MIKCGADPIQNPADVVRIVFICTLQPYIVVHVLPNVCTTLAAVSPLFDGAQGSTVAG